MAYRSSAKEDWNHLETRRAHPRLRVGMAGFSGLLFSISACGMWAAEDLGAALFMLSPCLPGAIALVAACRLRSTLHLYQEGLVLESDGQTRTLRWDQVERLLHLHDARLWVLSSENTSIQMSDAAFGDLKPFLRQRLAPFGVRPEASGFVDALQTSIGRIDTLLEDMKQSSQKPPVDCEE